MDHVVYVDAQARELETLLSGEKTMIIRGATGRKLPHGRVSAGDRLYFVRNNGEGVALARAAVRSVFNSDKLTPEDSVRLVDENQPALCLTERQRARWAGKRYLVMIAVEAVESIAPLPIDRSAYGNMDDWLPVGDIALVTPQ